MKTITCIDKDKNTYEVEADSLRWRPSVYGIIIQDGKILLSPQWDGYDLPGGGIDLGEMVEDGLIREVKEETGMDVTVGSLIDCKTSFFNIGEGEDAFIHSILLYYTATVVGGSLSTEGFDEAEKSFVRLAEWIPISEIDNINFKSSVKVLPIIKKVIN